VLTEPARFDGSLTHLTEAARALAPHQVPAMRKDFLVDPYQVLEARAAGAGGVLLILRMLSPETLGALIECARSHELFVLLEAFDAHDLERMREVIAADAGRSALLAGVNCRDLATLEVVPERLLELAPLLPVGVPHVAESGVESAADARRLAAAGYGLILVGSALMRDQDPAALARALLEAGRTVRRTS
jgi:indole-3-glycerol phosphate synthase